MSGAQFKVSGTPGTSSCKVLLNGEEIQNSIRGLTIKGEAGGVFGVELDLTLIDDLGFDTPDANVFLPDHTRHLLIRLGWTPPTS
jgi:hypothetical protein